MARNRFSSPLVAILTSGILIGSISLARADQGPEIVDVSFTVDGVCDFPVLVELHGKSKTIFLSGDRVLSTSPGLEATFTNLDAPENQTTMGITGAFHQRLLENGDLEFVATGRNLLVGLDAEARFLVTIGTFRAVLAPDGNVVEPLTGSGREIDVCQLLE